MGQAEREGGAHRAHELQHLVVATAPAAALACRGVPAALALRRPEAGADVVFPSIDARIPGPALARRSEWRGAQHREPEQRGGAGGHAHGSGSGAGAGDGAGARASNNSRSGVSGA